MRNKLKFEKDQNYIVFRLDASLQLRIDKNLAKTNLYNTIIIHNACTYLKILEDNGQFTFKKWENVFNFVCTDIL